MPELYDSLGRCYGAARRTDPTLAAAIHAALDDARTVLNVGAGTGSYEPHDREVVAVEPSPVMRAQRPPGAAPAVDAHAEALPFPDASFDATLAVLTDHHWADRARGLAELRRVAARRAVLFTFDAAHLGSGWLGTYLPELGAAAGMPIDAVVRALGATEIRPVPVPRDCRDGFLHAHWARPHAYLDARVRAGISVFSLLDAAVVDRFVAHLRADLDSGRWAREHGHMLRRDELDLGYRLLIADRRATVGG